MLSYRHAFHAGNHADVLKHFILQQVLSYATQKEKALYYIDTHAGAGMYALDAGFATKNAEYATGIARLWQADDLPEPLSDFVSVIQSFNPDSSLKLYPGSPALAAHLLRDEDKLRLFELHPNDFKILDQNCKDISHYRRRVILEMKDGFNGIKAFLPPPSRRAAVLIDPPYEQKEDYQRVVSMLKDSLTRFETGTYMLWYPILQRPEPAQMVADIHNLNPKNWLHVSLNVQNQSTEGFGMHGSGMFIINPPWTLPKILAETMPYLVSKLGLDDGASFSLDSHIS